MSEFFEWRDAPRADFAVIGDPVEHSLSPLMHSAAYSALGLPYRYVAIRVPQGEVAESLDHLISLGYRGLNVTLPLKAEAFRWAIQPDAFTKKIGAANTLELATRRATNTDGQGFMDSIQGVDLPVPSRVLVLGAGGTARSVLPKLVDAGHKVSIWNRTRERAQSLIDELSLHAKVVDAPATMGYRLLVNATSAEAKGEELDIAWSEGAGCTAYDAMYGDGPTPFLQQAVKHGWAAIDGKALLVAQGARSFTWWLGQEAPMQAMAEAVGA
ncbi:MAG: shikimate dehydrogenase [Fimbriimonadaceae bacterium]